MNIPAEKVAGNQANALITTVRFVPPNIGDDDKKLWTHIYPQHSVMMIRVEQPDSVLVGLGQKESDIGTKYGSLYFPQDNNMLVEGYNIQAVNALIAELFVEKVTQLELRAAAPGTQQADIVCDYTKHIDLGFEFLKQWRIGGIVGNPPATTIDTNNINRERHVLTYIKGHNFCENLWGETIYGGDFAFIVGKMIPIQVSMTANRVVKYGLGNSRFGYVTLPGFQNVVHYVPQFVAISSKTTTVPLDMLAFSVKDAAETKEVVRAGMPKLVGRCDQNTQYRETFVPSNQLKRYRFTLGVPYGEEDEEDVNAQCFETPLDDMQVVMNRVTIHMNFMVTV